MRSSYYIDNSSLQSFNKRLIEITRKLSIISICRNDFGVFGGVCVPWNAI